MLAITKKVAAAWQINFAQCPAVSSGRWVVDFSLDACERWICLVTHQDTLYTIVFYDQRPTSEQVLARIAAQAPWFQLSIADLYARNGNRRVTGSMLDMRFLASSVALSGGCEEEMQYLINKTPYSMLGMGRPKEAVAALQGR